MNFFKNNFFCHFVETTNSTNLLLNEIVEKNRENSLPDFFCVTTDFQTSGKGQGTKKWLSAKGKNILISFYFQPIISPPQQIYFNYFFALTIRKTLSLYVDNVMIKKPNDIWVDEKKIAGILIEHHIQGEDLKYSVAGVGININQTKFDKTLANPTSLRLLTKKNLNREQILQEIVQIGNEYYEKLQKNAFNELEKEYEFYVRNSKWR
jgi:BirA family biotin operon repressor/biotin-[acetyl-CoA-carboxylase] ligase